MMIDEKCCFFMDKFYFRWIHQILSVIEIMEVFLEIAALQYGGVTMKWIVIVAVQVLKYF